MEERLNDFVPLETIAKNLILANKREIKHSKDLEFKLGQEKAYSEELEFTIKQLKNTILDMKKQNKEWSKEIKREIAYTNIKQELQRAQEKVKKLKDVRDSLIAQLYTK